MISRKWRANWANLTPFFAYPPEIRKVKYTTNAIEVINAQLRKVTKKRGSFPNPEAVRSPLPRHHESQRALDPARAGLTRRPQPPGSRLPRTTARMTHLPFSQRI